uniref:Uncharacterized protein n=1 Tax=Physcomitrium patens TaxID=3218 RepID=A0A2K1L3U1_PHYPA|nr:hypothetical protein PHYPA_003487 [Physcomitrium patens]
MTRIRPPSYPSPTAPWMQIICFLPSVHNSLQQELEVTSLARSWQRRAQSLAPLHRLASVARMGLHVSAATMVQIPNYPGGGYMFLFLFILNSMFDTAVVADYNTCASLFHLQPLFFFFFFFLFVCLFFLFLFVCLAARVLE